MVTSLGAAWVLPIAALRGNLHKQHGSHDECHSRAAPAKLPQTQAQQPREGDQACHGELDEAVGARLPLLRLQELAASALPVSPKPGWALAPVGPERLHQVPEADASTLLEEEQVRLLLFPVVLVAVNRDEQVEHADAEDHGGQEHEAPREDAVGVPARQHCEVVEAVAIAHEQGLEEVHEHHGTAVMLALHVAVVLDEQHRHREAEEDHSRDEHHLLHGHEGLQHADNLLPNL
mmetsp:Transcript_59424/g.173893  ORF Transcript_59424/g.173893 Transcript_59424/m.173893 type:complete len:234 (+) Transcript_59424:374-1075(+)